MFSLVLLDVAAGHYTHRAFINSTSQMGVVYTNCNYVFFTEPDFVRRDAINSPGIIFIALTAVFAVFVE
jgi:hypothetical protein